MDFNILKGGIKMKKILSLLFVIITFSFILTQCSPEQREHLNPLDPEYTGTTDNNSNDDNDNNVLYHTGIITFNSNSYTGTNTVASITLIDADLTAATVTVNVKSTTDSTGLSVTLTKGTSAYTGTIGFTVYGTSGGNKIKVSQGDTITVLYNDANPAGTRTATATWYSNFSGTNYLGLYTETYSTPVWDSEIQLYNWNYTCLTTSDVNDSTEAREGSVYQRGVVIDASQLWWGWGIAAINGFNNPTNHNRSEYAGGSLHLSIMASNNNNIKVGIKDSTTEYWVYLNAYGFSADGNWHTITIPFSAFPGMDFSQVTYYFMMNNGGDPLTNGQVYHLDNIYWSKP